MRAVFSRSHLGIALFLAALCLPVATGLPSLLSLGDDVSVQENRKLNAWPGTPITLRALRRWPWQFQRWFNDRFGLRDTLIDLHNYSKARLGVSPSNRVILGRDGWIFINSASLMDANRGARPFAPGEARRLAEHFAASQAHLEERGISYVHLTPPDKQSLFRDQLPARIRYVGPSRYGDWREAALASALNFVDVYPALQQSVDAGETPYMQTDSHWNCYGAFLAYQEVMRALNTSRRTPLPVLRREDVTFSPRVDPIGGDLVRNSLGTPYLFPESLAMKCDITEAADATYTVLDTNRPLTLPGTYVAARASRVVNHAFPDGPRALVFRDSYTNAMIAFLNRSFGEIIYVAAALKPANESLIVELQPDIVIYEHVERTLMRFGNVRGADGLPLSESRERRDG